MTSTDFARIDVRCHSVSVVLWGSCVVHDTDRYPAVLYFPGLPPARWLAQGPLS